MNIVTINTRTKQTPLEKQVLVLRRDIRWPHPIISILNQCNQVGTKV